MKGRHLFGEGHLLERERLVEEIRYSLSLPFFRADITLFKVSDELLHLEQWTFNSKITPLYCLIAKVLHNYEFELEILILVVLSYCGVSNMVSRRPLFFFINSYSNIILPITYLFFIYFIAIAIKLSYALFQAVV